jgi:xylulokinase
VGNLILPGYTASKIRWLAKNHSKLFARMDCILLPHDYLNYCLTGERCMEMGDASGTGLLNIRERSWSSEMLSAVDDNRDLSDCLPELHAEPACIGTVTTQAASSFGLPAGIPVATGGGDNMMGAIGTGNLRAGKVTMSLGTSGTVYAHSDQPAIDPQGEIAAFCSSSGAWLPLLCTMNCTVTTELIRSMFDTGIEGFEQQVNLASAGSDGIVTLPFFNGERTPNLPHAKACILGLESHNTRPENLLRSAMEGASFALRYGIDRISELGIKTDEIVLTGGGSKSATWRQVIADVCNSPVTILDQDEGASFGAALQALSLLEGFDGKDLSELADDHLTRHEDRCCEPVESGVNSYRDCYENYQEAVRTITPFYQ